tara:strand:- start:402 stop:575 length:174 start_codon:yes stop_codon:yes gene_type:complete
MLESISQEQFEHIIELLILYKKVNPKIDVYLSEKSIKDAFNFINTSGKDLANQLGLK